MVVVLLTVVSDTSHSTQNNQIKVVKYKKTRIISQYKALTGFSKQISKMIR